MSDWTPLAVVNVLAIALSPVLAVVISLWLQERLSKRRSQEHVFTTLVANRHRPVCDDNVRALHLVDAVFARDRRVRDLWHRYFDLLGSADGNSELGYKKREQLYRDMLVEMARVLGFRKFLEQGDIERVYTPVGLGEANRVQEETGREFLRVLRSSEHLGSARVGGPPGGAIVEPKLVGAPVAADSGGSVPTS